MTEVPRPSLAIFQALLETAADGRPRILSNGQDSRLEVDKIIGIFGFKPVPSVSDSSVIRYESDDLSMQGVMIHGMPVSFLEGAEGSKPQFEYRVFPKLLSPGIE